VRSRDEHTLRFGCAALLSTATLLASHGAGATARAPGDAESAPNAGEQPEPSGPPVSARLGGQFWLASWSGVPLTAFGVEGAFGVPLDVGALDFTPGIAARLLTGESEYGLRFSARYVDAEIELRPHGSARWLRVGMVYGYAYESLARATPGEPIAGGSTHVGLRLSADVLRFNDWCALWLGAGARTNLHLSSLTLQAGVRL
jgi:hypothetical protein